MRSKFRSPSPSFQRKKPLLIKSIEYKNIERIFYNNAMKEHEVFLCSE
jgi:hypothetical protein